MEHDYNRLLLALAAVTRMRKIFTLSPVKAVAVDGPLAKIENFYGVVISIGFAIARLSKKFWSTKAAYP